MMRNAARALRAAFALLLPSIAGCQPAAVIGVYRDAGGRCDPLGSACGAAMACTLRGDPAMDACRAVGSIAVGAPCDALDSCVSGAQCASVRGGVASFGDLASGVCLAVCARDAPGCAQCIDIADGTGGTRLDFGLCSR